jgi:hypothetical protein
MMVLDPNISPKYHTPLTVKAIPTSVITTDEISPGLNNELVGSKWLFCHHHPGFLGCMLSGPEVRLKRIYQGYPKTC